MSVRNATPAPDRDWLVPLPDPPPTDDAEDRTAANRAAIAKGVQRDQPSVAM